jgi:hypothetical protein
MTGRNEAWVSSVYPELLEELHGVAETSGVAFEDLLGPAQLTRPWSCVRKTARCGLCCVTCAKASRWSDRQASSPLQTETTPAGGAMALASPQTDG